MNTSTSHPCVGLRSAAWRVLLVITAPLTIGAAATPWTVGPGEVTFVRDQAGLMTPSQRNAVSRHHRHLLDNHDIDYRVVTTAGLSDMDAAAVTLFRELGESSLSRRGRGLLLLIDTQANRVRLEVGYPLEGTFTDAFVDYVERQQMLPFFGRNRVADGILAATELVVARAQASANAMGASSDDWKASSGGGGASNPARLGAGAAKAIRVSSAAVQPGDTPEQTLRAYLEAMARHDSSPALAIYTRDTRAMLAGWVTTPAQMDNVVGTYGNCRAEPSILSADGRRAVIRFPASQPTCAPFFFEWVEGHWLLDLTLMQRAIRFGADNSWHFVSHAPHPYTFAFEN